MLSNFIYITNFHVVSDLYRTRRLCLLYRTLFCLFVSWACRLHPANHVCSLANSARKESVEVRISSLVLTHLVFWQASDRAVFFTAKLTEFFTSIRYLTQAGFRWGIWTAFLCIYHSGIVRLFCHNLTCMLLWVLWARYWNVFLRDSYLHIHSWHIPIKL